MSKKCPVKESGKSTSDVPLRFLDGFFDEGVRATVKIFISHASSNRDVVSHFAHLLESVSSDIDVFCSSQEGSVRIGGDFVEAIIKELSDSDLFIPVISQEYYDSRFCMIELGIASAYLFDKYRKNGEDYIFPFVLFPIKKNGALSGTPISNLQAGELNNPGSLRSFFDNLVEDKGIRLGEKVNRKLASFAFNVDQITLKTHDILREARPNTYFDDSIYYVTVQRITKPPQLQKQIL